MKHFIEKYFKKLAIAKTEKMTKVGQYKNVSIIVRNETKQEQKFMDYIAQNKVYGDGRETVEDFCFLNNIHSVYFELMIDNDYSKRIGLCGHYLDFSQGRDFAINEYVNNKLIPKIKNNPNKYTNVFNKV